MVRIIDDNGEELALATLGDGEDQLLTIERVIRGKGRLLQYYFAKGRRVVHVEAGEFFLTGTIVTTWLGAERLWMIKLAQPGSEILPAYRRRMAQWRPAS
ncbi:MAG TPA: hypothetical protein VIK11_14050 [Tepidiformaceae bacterium]|jgi:hypothetical protein